MSRWPKTAPAEQDILTWKLLRDPQKPEEILVAVCRIPAGATYGLDDESKTCRGYRSTQLFVEAVGVWDEAHEPTRLSLLETERTFQSAGCYPGYVTYRLGKTTENADGLVWSYALPWQTYWPFSPFVSARKTLDATAVGRGILRITPEDC